MPQITIDYSGNLGSGFDPRELARRIHEDAVTIIDTELVSCKTRIREITNFVIGNGGPNQAMIHVELGILHGRTDQQKRQLADAVLDAAGEFIEKSAHMDLQLTVEVRNLDREHYYTRLI